MTHNLCQRVWQVEAARDGRLTGSELSNSLRHRTECADCEQTARALDQLGRTLKALPVRRADQLTRKRTRQALLNAWNEQLLVEPRPHARSRILLIAACCAIASVALAVVYPLARSGSQSVGTALVRQPERSDLQPKAKEPFATEPNASISALPGLPAAPPEPVKATPGSPSAKSRSAPPKRAPATAAPVPENAEDDAYLQIVNLLRSGRKGEARAKAAHYLAQFPHGFRRLEVASIAQP